jgi:hypothetical protein
MTLALAVPIAVVAGAWLGLLILLTGLGHGLLRAIYPDISDLSNDMAAGTASWLGYCGVVIFLQLWHLFFAVDWRALITLSALSAAGWLAAFGPRAGHRTRHSPETSARSPSARPLRRRGTALLVALALVWLADRAIGPFNSYDGANYHLQTIKWNHEYAAVPGLANVNANFGFAGSSLLVAALFEDGVFWGRGQHFLNGFLIALLFCQVCAGVTGILRSNEPTPSQAAALVLLFPLILHLDDDAVATYSTDLPVTAVIYAAVILACSSLGRPASSTAMAAPRVRPELFAALSLLAIAPCLKASCGMFAAAVWLGLALVVVFNHRPPAVRRLLPAAGIACCAFIPWAIGNAILTGYPLYPLPLGALRVDWRLPRFHLDGLLWWTEGYAHTPEAWDLMVNRHGFNWLPYWLWFELRTAVEEVLLPIFLVVLLAGIWLATRKRPAGRGATVAYLLYPVGLAIALWFLVAPSIRFGRFMFWSAATILAAAVLPRSMAPVLRRRRVAALLVTVWVASPLLLQTYFVVKHRHGGGAAEAVFRRFVVAPGPDHGLHPLVQVATQGVTVCDGLVVYRPTAPDALRATDRWAEALPWDAPLPATANLLPQLCPRRPGELQAGFRIPPLSAPWPRVNSGLVRRLRDETGWSVGQLAVHFFVRPELIKESLQ